MATTADYDLGPATFPRGWFMIAQSAEVGQRPLPLRYFGRDFAIYRGTSGKAYLVDAYCPHMGAHLAKNTTSYIVRDGEQVQGESIRCPFHGWRFGPDGQCDDIPYSSFIPKAACLPTFPIVERAGAVWLWHDEEGGAPDIALPDFAEWDMEDEGWVRWTFDDFGVLPTHPVEIVDNMADLAHMTPIHGSHAPRYFDNEFAGDRVSQSFWAGHRTLTAGGGGSDELLRSEAYYTGPAILQAPLGGEFPAIMLIAHTPVEDGAIRMYHALMVKASDRRPTEAQRAAAAAYQAASLAALAQDVEVWANKRAMPNILQIPADGPFGRVRTWYRQFYNPRAAAEALQRRVDGRDVRRGEARPADATVALFPKEPADA